jgi:hypothetical protein
MDVRTRALRIPPSAFRHDAAHVRPDRNGIHSALWLASKVPARTRPFKGGLRVSMFFLHLAVPRSSVRV